MYRVPCTVCWVPGVVCRVPCVVCRESKFLLSSFTVTVHGACEYKVATQFACLSAYATGRENERSVGRASGPLRPAGEGGNRRRDLVAWSFDSPVAVIISWDLEAGAVDIIIALDIGAQRRWPNARGCRIALLS